MTDLTKFSLLKRRADISPDSFLKHWHDINGPILIAAGHPEFNADYVQNHFAALSGDSASQAFNGAAQMRQRSDSMVDSGFQSDPRYMQYVRPDHETFLDVAQSQALFTRPKAIKGPSTEPCKLMVFAAWAKATEPGTQPGELEAWEHRLLQMPASADVVACVHYYTLQGAMRGLATNDFDEQNRPTHQYDVVLEYRFADAQARSAFASHLASHWPGAVQASSAFMTLAEEKRMY